MARPRALHRRHPRVEGEEERRRPRAQLPGPGDLPRGGRHHRRLAGPRPQGGGDGRRRDRHGRRPLHGRDGEDPQSGEDGPDARPRGRLLARRLDHRRGRAPSARAVPRRPGSDLRQHLGRGEGRVRRLLHLGQRRGGRRVAEGPAGHLPARRVPREVRGLADEDRGHPVEGPLRGARALLRRRDPVLPPAAPGRDGPGAPRVPARRPRGLRLRGLHRRHGPAHRCGAPVAGRPRHRVLDGRQRRRRLPEDRVRPALQPLSSHEADHPAEDPALAPGDGAPGRGGAGRGGAGRRAVERMLAVGRGAGR